MPESDKHILLVQNIKEWIFSKYNSNNVLLMSDTSDSTIINKPKRIENYCPDIYARINYRSNKNYVIGEAKISQELEKYWNHAEDQIKAFLKFCKSNENSLFILAVPWKNLRNSNQLIKYFLNDIEIDAKDINYIIICDIINLEIKNYSAIWEE
ncbi:MAG: hypothetical protein V1874_08850 [Spirochaetota bacterium]